LIGLGVGLENRRMSGENEVLPENLEADVLSQDRTYGPKYHNGRTIQSITGNFIFISRFIAPVSLF
jgi:hypothetical protein